MAEEDTRTGAGGGARGDGDGGGAGNGDDEGEEGDVGRRDSRRYGDGSGDEEWLQLTLGTSRPPAISRSDSDQPAGILERNLFPDRPSVGSRTRPSTSLGTGNLTGAPSVPLFPNLGHLPSLPWVADGTGASSSVPLLPPRPPYSPRQVLMYMSGSGGLGFPVVGGGRTPGELRVLSPSSRPPTGLWFFLQASENQAKEPFLAQVPKSYLRIKDGRTTIRLLMKYLVNKLGLDNESEVELTCRGRQLHPHLTLQYVRDQIWRPRDALAALSDSPINHVMTLQYGRSTSNLP